MCYISGTIYMEIKKEKQNNKGENKMTETTTEIYRKKLIEELTGERLVVDAEWLKENDSEQLDWITSSEYWGRGSDRIPDPSEAIVELKFGEEGVTYYADLKSSQDNCPSQNQPPWGEDTWEDWAVEEIEKYWKKLQLRNYKKEQAGQLVKLPKLN